MKNKTLKTALCLLVLASCNQSNNTMFPEPEGEVLIAKKEAVSVDRIVIDSLVTSLEGTVHIQGNNLYFFDNNTCALYMFDTDGNLLKKTIGKGNANTEIAIGASSASTFLNDGSFCILGGNDGLFTYDQHLKQDLARTYSHVRKLAPSVLNADKYDSYYIASIPTVCRSFGNAVFTSNAAESKFNYFDTPEFTTEYRTLTKHDLERKKSDKLLGKGLPTMYHGTQSKNFIFQGSIFDIDKDGNFYVSYLADSLIYMYDKDYNPIKSFGYAGSKMDKDYKEISSISDYETLGSNYMTKGFYTWIEYIEELDLLLRSYQKGENASCDGLQIYKGNTLIGDIEVSKGFKPIGYIEPYIYSNYVVGKDESLTIPRIQL